MKKTVALVVLDGMGYSKNTEGNAVRMAKTPFFNSLLEKYPHTLLRASGRWVGLKNGQMGNSETGHMNIGAGRVVKQDLTIIDDSIADGSFFKNKNLIDFFEDVKRDNGSVHMVGLLSNGGIHSHINHLFACLEVAKARGMKDVYLHVITDGRDTDTNSAISFVKEVIRKTKQLGVGKIISVAGRYYTMDRDKYYDRVKLSYDVMVRGLGSRFSSPEEAITASYKAGITDEFIVPAVIAKEKEQPVTIGKKDGVLFFNFRKDRTKELTECLTSEKFDRFKTNFVIRHFISMTNYGENFAFPTMFESNIVREGLIEVLSENDKTIGKFAEPTKFPHVTYFFNGGKEEVFKGEERFKTPAKEVATFDLAPEMSAVEIAEEVVKQTRKDRFDFILINLANCDMVGHTGNIKATVKAVETVDRALKIITEHILKIGGELLVTADHGNAERMFFRNKICTTHSNNPVPLIYVSGSSGKKRLLKGSLVDLSPTVLDILNIPFPTIWTGKSLLK